MSPFDQGVKARSKKQKKVNPYPAGSASWQFFEDGWNAHKAGSKVAKKTKKVVAPVSKKPKTYVGFCLDRSGSMYGLRDAVIKAYNTQTQTIRDRAVDQDIRVSTNSFGDNVTFHMHNRMASELKDMTTFEYRPSGQTPLFDAVGEMIQDFQGVSDVNEKDVSFLLLIVTDGYENASRNFNASRVASMIQNLQKTDRWTFAFLVPPGNKDYFVRTFSIPEGNVREWEATTRGVQEYTQATTNSMNTYFKARSAGTTSVMNFYTDLSGVKTATVKSKLVDISREILTFNVSTNNVAIRPFIEKALGRPMLKGAAFYQLVKAEKAIQDYKQIMIREKKTGHVYSGVEARNLLGLPHNGTIKVVPGNHGAYDIFVQSTSVNRKLPAGTQVVYWEKVGQAFTTNPSWR